MMASFVTFPLPLSVVVRTTGDTTAGEMYSLTCTVVELEDITDAPQVVWVGPAGETVSSGDGIILGPTETNGSITTSTLEFNPLKLSHAGEYTCKALIVSLSQERSISHTINVHSRVLSVTVLTEPTGPSYQAASPVTLTCAITGNFSAPASYNWTSTCSGDCIIPGTQESVVYQPAVHSIDAGNHTCIVTDAAGNQGTAITEVQVYSVGINADGVGLLSNNSILMANENGTVPMLQCISGTTVPNVGQWIAPNGEDITYGSVTDPFDVTVGGSNNPGVVIITPSSGHFLTSSFDGVYTCNIPDRSGMVKNIHIGIYPYDFNTIPSILSLGITPTSSSLFTLSCVSTASPATTVTWTKNNVVVTNSNTYKITQVLLEGSTSTYANLLQINAGPYGVTGTYTCNITNSLGSAQRSISFSGLQISTSAVVFEVGGTESVTCSSDLDVISIEWLHDGRVVSSSNNTELELPFNPVYDNIHDSEYTCRITSPYGIQEETTRLIATVLPDDFYISITAVGEQVAGEMYTLNCTITIPEGITTPPTVQWRDSSGILSTWNITEYSGNAISHILEFNPLRVSHGGQFVCQAVIITAAPPFTITSYAEFDITPKVLGLQVSVTPTPDLGSTMFPAGSSLTLTCNVEGGHLPIMYDWSSMCGPGCFVSNQSTQSLTQDVLRSIDSGVHTCSATDAVGNYGNGSITITSAGIGLYITDYGLVQNKSIIPIDASNRFKPLQCVSASTTPNIGKWIAPNGEDISNKFNDSFAVMIGDDSNPGSVTIQPEDGYSLSSADQGIYSCIIPEIDQYFHVGLYQTGFSSLPRILSLQNVRNITSALLLNCTSTGSPASSVVWTKDGVNVADNETYSTYQILRDGVTATYDNILMANAGPFDLTGTYTCIIHDSLGHNSAPASVEVNGIEISGYSSPLTVGESAQITCSSDLDVTTIEWLYNGEIITTSNGPSSILVFETVYSSFHNRQYTCKVTTPYGEQEDTITIIVEFSSPPLTVYVSSTEIPVAGYPYALTCTVSRGEGVSGSLQIIWEDPDGQPIMSDGEITVGTPQISELVANVTLNFTTLRFNHEGLYTCVAAVESVLPFNSSDAQYLKVLPIFPVIVSIVDVYDSNGGPEYKAGSAIALSCTASNTFPPVNYHWTSTCSDCFVFDQSSNDTIAKDILHSRDSGNHTCSVTDDVGNTGNATFNLHVYGVTLYSGSDGPLENNDIIVADTFGQISSLQCISGLLVPNIGHWIAPDRQDITFSTSDPFAITRGDGDDPGYFEVSLENGQPLTFADQGVYTCQIPDDIGTNVSLHVGIYLPSSSNPVRIVSLQESTYNGPYELNCTSTDSPPTNVTWIKNGEMLSAGDMYQMTEILRDGTTATYDNVLTVYGEPDGVTGSYTCSIDNRISEPTDSSLTVQGLQIIGNTTIVVGQEANISCFADIKVNSIQWTYSDTVLATTSSQQLELDIGPVFDYLHDREYTCRATTPYGTLTRTIILEVDVPPKSLNVSIITVDSPVAGSTYELLCVASVAEGILGTPFLEWENTTDSDITLGTLSSEEGVTTLPLEFAVLRVSHTGSYTCHATLYSLALETPLLATATTTTSVQTSVLSVVVVSNAPGLQVNAATSLTLTCEVVGGSGAYSYLWSSNCTGNCFVPGQTSQSIVRSGVMSTDSGNHSCWVIDDAGNAGGGSISITVTGVGLYMASGTGPVSNNSVITSNINGRISPLHCLSGSLMPNVGQWIAPDGMDVTNESSDVFEVTVGGNENPGSLQVVTPADSSLTAANEGVYTCIIPDNKGMTEYLYVGIYLADFNDLPTVISLSQSSISQSALVLNCTSTNSPATSVTWTKDGMVLYGDSSYQMSQVLRDGITATYDSILTVVSETAEFPGTYGCTISNAIGISSTATLTLQGLHITGNDAPLTVGTIATITCTYDFGATAVEWLYDGQVLVSTAGSQAELVLNPVNDSLHNVQYICRVISSYGILESNTSISVTVPSSSLSVSITEVGNATDGEEYSLICLASKAAGLQDTVKVEWLDSAGNAIDNLGAIMLRSENISEDTVSLTLDFNPLHTSHGAAYVCQAVINSPALSSTLTTSGTIDVAVQISEPDILLLTSDEEHYAGSSLTLTCKTELRSTVDTGVIVATRWKKGGMDITASDQILISSTSQTSAWTYESTVSLNPLSQVLHTGLYKCEVSVHSYPPSSFVLLATNSAMQSIDIQSPLLDVDVTPTTATVLDISPYNVFTLTCTATQPSTVTVPKMIEWRETTAGVIETDLNTNITTTGIDDATTTSILSVIVDSAGTKVYSCHVKLEIPGDPTVSQYQSSHVTIKGQSFPQQPTELSHTAITFDSATVTWVIPAVAYTPELYTIFYSTSQASLQSSSSVSVEGTTDLASTNKMYSVILTNLEEATTYYYQVVSMNSIGSNTTGISQFTTPMQALSISTTVEGNSTAGDQLILTCSVELVEGYTGILDVVWTTTNGNVLVTDGSVFVEAPSTLGSVTTLIATFSPLNTSHGGQYMCQATLNSPELGSPTSAIVILDVTVQIPSPSIDITGLPDVPIYTGTSLDLTCTVKINDAVDTGVIVGVEWKRNGELVIINQNTNVTDVEVYGSTYMITLTIRPVDNTVDNGHYTCESTVQPDPVSVFIHPAAGSETSNIAVSALPPPVVAVSDEGDAVAGQTYALICTVSVVEDLVDSATLLITWTDSDNNTVSSESTFIGIQSSPRVLSLQFDPLRTSHGGQYTCAAFLSIPELPLNLNTSYMADIIVKVPNPLVTLTAPPLDSLLAGSPLEFMCSVDLGTVPAIDTDVNVTVIWKQNNQELNNDSSNTRIMSATTQGAVESLYESLLQFSTLSSLLDSGTYTCTGVVTPTVNENYVTVSTETASYTITVVDPSITVELYPSSYSGIDVVPYNSFTFTCNASKPGEIVPTLELNWYHEEEELDNSLITTESSGSDNSMLSSQLSLVDATSAHSGLYSCIARLNIPDSSVVEGIQTASVIVKGPAIPQPPTALFESVITDANSANISWLVASVAYTPENYSVVYGLFSDQLDTNSDIQEGSEDIASTNIVYSITVTNLQPFSQYYYSIIATNTFGSTSSSTYTFLTQSAVPGDAPTNVVVTNTSSSSVVISWDLPLTPNGDIIQYTVYVNYTNGSSTIPIVSEGIQRNITLGSLQPYQLIEVQVSAYTSAGEGPKSMSVTGRSSEEAPDNAPENVHVMNISSSSVLISWDPPPDPNGIITHYTLYFTEGSLTDTETTTDASYTLEGLQPYQLVVVQVSASTSAGEGPKSNASEGRASEEDLIAPTLSIMADGTATAGKQYSLLCTVTIGEGTETDVEIVWLNPEGQPLSSGGEIIVASQPVIGVDSRIMTVILSFSPLHTSRGGVYTCQATVKSPYLTLQETNSAFEEVIVQIPSPAVYIGQLPEILYAGSSFVMSCTIQLSEAVDIDVVVSATWLKDGEVLNGNDRLIVSDTTSTSTSAYEIQVWFTTLGWSIDDGQYECAATVLPQQTSPYIIISSDLDNDTVSFEVKAPTLVVKIQPTQTIALDAAPYNNFVLECNASTHETVVVPKLFQWIELEGDDERNLTDNGDTVVISYNDLEKPQSISLLGVSERTMGMYVYNCTTTMHFPGGLTVAAFAIADVTIQGPMNPIGPTDIVVTEITSNSITLEWNVVYLAYGPETYSVLLSTNEFSPGAEVARLNSTMDLTATNMPYAVTISGLHPATQYYVSISTANLYSVVTSNSTIHLETLEASPSGPPRQFNVTIAGPQTVEMSWSSPEEGNRNGIITGYTLACEPGIEGLPTEFAAPGSYVLEGLIPATQYTCTVYASTAPGNGPPASTTFVTPEDVPGPVENLDVISLSDTTLQIAWEPPENTNGLIQYYMVVVHTKDATVFNTSLSDGSQLNVLVMNLVIYIPYYITVIARTSAGLGEAVEHIAFTEEGTPNVAPKDVITTRLNGTHMNVSWQRLSLEEARGFISGYFITFIEIEEGNRRKRDTFTVEVGPDISYKAIGGLDLTKQYSVTVSGVTSAGEGTKADESTVNAPSSSTFQLRLRGVYSCNDWRIADASDKVMAISYEVAAALKEDYCTCTVSENYITDALLLCSDEPTDVIFRAKLYSTPDASNDLLISYLTEWVQSGTGHIVVLHIPLDLDPACEVEIGSFQDPLCTGSTGTPAPTESPAPTPVPTESPDLPSVETSEDGTDFSAVIIIVATVAGVGILIIVVICALHIFGRIRRRNKLDITRRLPVPGNEGVELNAYDENTYEDMRYEGLTISNESASGDRATAKAAEAAAFPLTFPQSYNDDYEPVEAILPTTFHNPLTNSDDESKDGMVEEGSSL